MLCTQRCPAHPDPLRAVGTGDQLRIGPADQCWQGYRRDLGGSGWRRGGLADQLGGHVAEGYLRTEGNQDLVIR